MTYDHPRLSTPRLSLRWFERDDAPLLFAIWNSPGFLRFVGDRKIRTVNDARSVYDDGMARQYETQGFGPFCLELHDGTGIGMCGLFSRPELDVPDLGFALLPQWIGRGFAFEAAEAVLKQIEVELSLPLVYAIVSPDNAASIGLLEKLGLQYQRMMRLAEDELMLYSSEMQA